MMHTCPDCGKESEGDLPERYERAIALFSQELRDECNRCILCKHGITDIYVAPKVWNKRDPKTPKDAVYVGRPSKWGNPFVIGQDGTRDQVIQMYQDYLMEPSHDLYDDVIAELRGKDLVCWCVPAGGIGLGDEPRLCHAQLLLRIANAQNLS